MSKAVSKRALQAIADNAQHFCDHKIPEDHERGYCDYVVITQAEITEVLEDSRT